MSPDIKDASLKRRRQDKHAITLAQALQEIEDFQLIAVIGALPLALKERIHELSYTSAEGKADGENS